MRDIIETYQQEHPDIVLDIQAIPPDGYKTRLKTVAAANEMPDVFLMWPGMMTKEFHGGGLIQPIDDLLNSKADWKSSFLLGLSTILRLTAPFTALRWDYRRLRFFIITRKY